MKKILYVGFLFVFFFGCKVEEGEDKIFDLESWVDSTLAQEALLDSIALDGTLIENTKKINEAPKKIQNSHKSYSYDVGAYNLFIAKYKVLAVQMMHETGIPASLTLSQALLESDAGRSKLAVKKKNLHGIVDHKLSKDKTSVNLYKEYNTPEESFRDHARVLTSKTYSYVHEKNFERTDYKGWVRAVSIKYAIDKNYADKIINIIETFKLNDLDTIQPKN